MNRRLTLSLLLVIAAVASTASILATIRHALRRDRGVSPEELREAERRRIREGMGDLLAEPLDLSEWPPHLRPSPDLPDRDTLRNQMRRFDRPAWMDLREERDAGP